MKIQRSDIRRFLHFAQKFLQATVEVEPPPVVLTFTERSYSIAMTKCGLMLTYLCNRIDSEGKEQVMALPFDFLRDFSVGSGLIELSEVIENGESYVEAKWNEVRVQRTKKVRAENPPEDHLAPDLAWHTVDERTKHVLRSLTKHVDREIRTRFKPLVQRNLESSTVPSTTAIH